MNDSRAVRFVVSALFKKSFANSLADLDSFHSDLEALKFLNLVKPDHSDKFFARFTYDYQGKTLKLENGEEANLGFEWRQVISAKSSFYKNGVLEFGYLASAQEMDGLLFKANRTIKFFESGKLKSGTLEQDEPNYLPTALKKGDEVVFFESGSLNKLFYRGSRLIDSIPCGENDNRRITGVHFYENKTFRACDIGNSFTYDDLDINYKLETYPSGKIKRAFLSNKTKLFSVKENVMRDFYPDKAVCLDESKRVIDCNTLDLVPDYPF
jgi:hypothetical protein